MSQWNLKLTVLGLISLQSLYTLFLLLNFPSVNAVTFCPVEQAKVLSISFESHFRSYFTLNESPSLANLLVLFPLTHADFSPYVYVLFQVYTFSPLNHCNNILIGHPTSIRFLQFSKLPLKLPFWSIHWVTSLLQLTSLNGLSLVLKS